MARYWSGTVGGIDLEEVNGDIAGFQIEGAEAFEYNTTGNSQQAITGFVHTQYAPFLYGKPLVITFLHAPQTLFRALIELLEATLPSGASVECTFTDGFQTINKMFKPNVPNWLSRGNPDGAYINDAVIRLISTGDVEEDES